MERLLEPCLSFSGAPDSICLQLLRDHIDFILQLCLLSLELVRHHDLFLSLFPGFVLGPLFEGGAQVASVDSVHVDFEVSKHLCPVSHTEVVPVEEVLAHLLVETVTNGAHVTTNSTLSLLPLFFLKSGSSAGDCSCHIRAQDSRLEHERLPSTISPQSIKVFLQRDLPPQRISSQKELDQVLVDPVMSPILHQAGPGFDQTIDPALLHVGCGCAPCVEDGSLVLNASAKDTQSVHPCTGILLLHEPSPPPHGLSDSIVDPILDEVEHNFPILGPALGLLPPLLKRVPDHSVIEPIEGIDARAYLLNLLRFKFLLDDLLM